MDYVVNNRLIRAMVLLLAFRALGLIAYRAAVAPGDLFLGDFGTYHLAAKRLNDGGPLYIHEEGPRLLFQCVSSPLIPELVRPFARFPVAGAFQVWVASNVAMLLLAVVLYCWGSGIRLLDDIAPALLVLFTAFRYWPTVLELAMGNSEVILLLAIATMFLCDRHGKWILFALVVALAALTKTWMIGAVFYLMARRKWAAAAAALGFFAAGGAILFSMVGWSEFPLFLEITRRYSSQPMLVSHSVAGMARMFFSVNPVMTPWVNSRALYLAVMMAGYGFLICGLLYLWLRGPEMNARQGRLCLGLTALALILGSPVSHQFYFVLALPLFWTLLAGSGMSWGIRLAAFALYLVFSVPTPGLNPLSDMFKHGIRSAEVAVNFATGMALWALGLFALTREFSTPGEMAVIR